MKESYTKQQQRKEREQRKYVAPTGRFLTDMPQWQISAMKASLEKRKREQNSNDDVSK